jgi:hypothetical protein
MWEREPMRKRLGQLRIAQTVRGGQEYAYEVLTFAHGKRNVQQIRDAVSAEYGPVSLEWVVEYLAALEKVGIVERVS